MLLISQISFSTPYFTSCRSVGRSVVVASNLQGVVRKWGTTANTVYILAGSIYVSPFDFSFSLAAAAAHPRHHLMCTTRDEHDFFCTKSTTTLLIFVTSPPFCCCYYLAFRQQHPCAVLLPCHFIDPPLKAKPSQTTENSPS